jgi:arylsulfatase A-like enzyme
METLIPRGPGEYFANVTYMDHQIGRLLEALRRLGHYDDTVIVFASDNGPVTENWRAWWEVNAHGSTGGLRGRKHRVYEGGIRVPAIVRHPGVTEPGTRSDALVIGTDLFPTLVGIAGAEVPQDRAIDGLDVTAVLRGARLPERTVLWALEDADGPDYAIRTGRWKLLLDEKRQPVALYDLDEDPLELVDVIGRHPQEVERLRDAFDARLAEIEADPLAPKR